MSQTLSIIGPGSRVVIHLSLALPDGSEVLSTFGEQPLRCVMGDGALQPGLEQALFGLKTGDKENIALQAGVAYGEPDDSLIHELERDQFTDMAPEPDQIIGFSLPNGEETAGRVLELTEEGVRVDFNHPLAGLPLQLQVEVLEVEP